MPVESAARWLARMRPGTRAVFRITTYGFVAGLVAVAFHVCIHFLYENGIIRLSHASVPVFLIGSFLIVGATSGVSGWLLSVFCPQAAGSGIPQLKVAFWKDFGLVPWRVLWVKFVGGSCRWVGAQAWDARGRPCNSVAGFPRRLRGGSVNRNSNDGPPWPRAPLRGSLRPSTRRSHP